MDVDDAMAFVQNVGVEQAFEHIPETQSSQARVVDGTMGGGAMEEGDDSNVHSSIAEEGAAIPSRGEAPPHNGEVTHL